MQTVPVILAGGIGERFWPLSRSSSPKQLHAIASERSMLEETLFRIRSCCPNSTAPLIITGAAIAGKTAAALAAVDTRAHILNGPPDGVAGDAKSWMSTLMAMDTDVNIIAEPQGKNTAPAIALAAALITAKHEDSVMLVASADHLISPIDAFERAIYRAINIAVGRGGLVVFGVKPDRPETGYGYIEVGEQLAAGADIGTGGCAAFKVKRFVEKPNAGDAAAFMESGKFLWNSGMFVWKASVILEAFKKFMPDLHKQALAAADKGFTPEAINEFYSVCPKESIDYGIMEKAEDVSAVCGDFSWDDVGSWESLSRVLGSNNAGTTAAGTVYESGCGGSLIINKSSKQALAAIGLNNVAIVAVDDAILAIDRARLPELKKYLAEIKNSGKFPADLF
jgi:mannose-1-phosphate guanylyltransferase